MILVVGSVAIDSIKTPFGEKEEVLGGSAVYFSYSASFFFPHGGVNLVGVVGDDFPKEHLQLLKKRHIDTKGLKIQDGKTFRWKGSYEYDLNEAKTLSTCLNVFETFKPEIPSEYKKSPYVFLANIDPELQMSVLSQIEKPKLVGADTMNLWIKTKRKEVLKLLTKIDILTINDGEARQLTEQPSLVKAGKILLNYGPKYVVIKKGEHGSLLFSKDDVFSLPAYPLEEVFDPTGAGDSFAGGFFGYISKTGKTDKVNLRKAMVFGSALASFCVEDFSLERLKRLKLKEIYNRYEKFRELTCF